MDRQEALHVFNRFGSQLSADDNGGVREAWISLARRYHARATEDRTNERAMAEINAAYEVLKRTQAGASGVALTLNDPRIRGVCVWAWAGHPGGAATAPSDRIEMLDERDPNFVKRALWLLSDRSKEEWTIWSFDGRRFMAPLTVYSNSRLLAEMARMALRFSRVGFRRPRAIFVQKAGSTWSRLMLVHADGNAFPGVPFNFDGGTVPSRDQAFVGRLPAMLDDLQKVGARR
ncbi:MAG: hypothetical protein V4653_17780 [Pseudomonadota bacterium]